MQGFGTGHPCRECPISCILPLSLNLVLKIIERQTNFLVCKYYLAKFWVESWKLR